MGDNIDISGATERAAGERRKHIEEEICVTETSMESERPSTALREQTLRGACYRTLSQNRIGCCEQKICPLSFSVLAFFYVWNGAIPVSRGGQLGR